MSTLTNFLGTNRQPYIERVVGTAFPGYVSSNSVFCTNTLTTRADCVCLIELIWSYWPRGGHAGSVDKRHQPAFPERAQPGDRDPLAHVTIDPLRPLNNLLWGYVQDEQNRLTVKRRVPSTTMSTASRCAARRSSHAAGGQPLEIPRGLP
jgi:hypothetical protein